MLQIEATFNLEVTPEKNINTLFREFFDIWCSVSGRDEAQRRRIDDTLYEEESLFRPAFGGGKKEAGLKIKVLLTNQEAEVLYAHYQRNMEIIIY